MAFVLIFVGIVLFVVAYNNNQNTFVSLLKADVFTTNFIYWVVAVFLLGALGYITKFKGLSNSFLVLILLVFVIANKGFFQKFNEELAKISSLAGQSSPANAHPIGDGNSPIVPLIPYLGIK